MVAILTETRSGSQGFCERFKNQGLRLNPQYIAVITTGWTNVGLRYNIAIQLLVSEMWPIINDINRRLFTSTTSVEEEADGTDPSVVHYQPRASWAFPGMEHDFVVVWHTNKDGTPYRKWPLQSWLESRYRETPSSRP